MLPSSQQQPQQRQYSRTSSFVVEEETAPHYGIHSAAADGNVGLTRSMKKSIGGGGGSEFGRAFSAASTIHNSSAINAAEAVHTAATNWRRGSDASAVTAAMPFHHAGDGPSPPRGSSTASSALHHQHGGGGGSRRSSSAYRNLYFSGVRAPSTDHLLQSSNANNSNSNSKAAAAHPYRSESMRGESMRDVLANNTSVLTEMTTASTTAAIGGLMGRSDSGFPRHTPHVVGGAGAAMASSSTTVNANTINSNNNASASSANTTTSRQHKGALRKINMMRNQRSFVDTNILTTTPEVSDDTEEDAASAYSDQHQQEHNNTAAAASPRRQHRFSGGPTRSTSVVSNHNNNASSSLLFAHNSNSKNNGAPFHTASLASLAKASVPNNAAADDQRRGIFGSTASSLSPSLPRHASSSSVVGSRHPSLTGGGEGMGMGSRGSAAAAASYSTSPSPTQRRSSPHARLMAVHGQMTGAAPIHYHYNDDDHHSHGHAGGRSGGGGPTSLAAEDTFMARFQREYALHSSQGGRGALGGGGGPPPLPRPSSSLSLSPSPKQQQQRQSPMGAAAGPPQSESPPFDVVVVGGQSPEAHYRGGGNRLHHQSPSYSPTAAGRSAMMGGGASPICAGASPPSHHGTTPTPTRWGTKSSAARAAAPPTALVAVVAAQPLPTLHCTDDCILETASSVGYGFESDRDEDVGEVDTDVEVDGEEDRLGRHDGDGRTDTNNNPTRGELRGHAHAQSPTVAPASARRDDAQQSNSVSGIRANNGDDAMASMVMPFDLSDLRQAAQLFRNKNSMMTKGQRGKAPEQQLLLAPPSPSTTATGSSVPSPQSTPNAIGNHNNAQQWNGGPEGEVGMVGAVGGNHPNNSESSNKKKKPQPQQREEERALSLKDIASSLLLPSSSTAAHRHHHSAAMMNDDDAGSVVLHADGDGGVGVGGHRTPSAVSSAAASRRSSITLPRAATAKRLLADTSIHILEEEGDGDGNAAHNEVLVRPTNSSISVARRVDSRPSPSVASSSSAAVNESLREVVDGMGIRRPNSHHRGDSTALGALSTSRRASVISQKGEAGAGAETASIIGASAGQDRSLITEGGSNNGGEGGGGSAATGVATIEIDDVLWEEELDRMADRLQREQLDSARLKLQQQHLCAARGARKGLRSPMRGVGVGGGSAAGLGVRLPPNGNHTTNANGGTVGRGGGLGMEFSDDSPGEGEYQRDDGKFPSRWRSDSAANDGGRGDDRQEQHRRYYNPTSNSEFDEEDGYDSVNNYSKAAHVHTVVVNDNALQEDPIDLHSPPTPSRGGGGGSTAAMTAAVNGHYPSSSSHHGNAPSLPQPFSSRRASATPSVITAGGGGLNRSQLQLNSLNQSSVTATSSNHHNHNHIDTNEKDTDVEEEEDYTPDVHHALPPPTSAATPPSSAPAGALPTATQKQQFLQRQRELSADMQRRRSSTATRFSTATRGDGDGDGGVHDDGHDDAIIMAPHRLDDEDGDGWPSLRRALSSAAFTAATVSSGQGDGLIYHQQQQQHLGRGGWGKSAGPNSGNNTSISHRSSLSHGVGGGGGAALEEDTVADALESEESDAENENGGAGRSSHRTGSAIVTSRNSSTAPHNHRSGVASAINKTISATSSNMNTMMGRDASARQDLTASYVRTASYPLQHQQQQGQTAMSGNHHPSSSSYAYAATSSSPRRRLTPTAVAALTGGVDELRYMGQRCLVCDTMAQGRTCRECGHAIILLDDSDEEEGDDDGL